MKSGAGRGATRYTRGGGGASMTTGSGSTSSSTMTGAGSWTTTGGGAFRPITTPTETCACAIDPTPSTNTHPIELMRLTRISEILPGSLGARRLPARDRTTVVRIAAPQADGIGWRLSYSLVILNGGLGSHQSSVGSHQSVGTHQSALI